MYQEILAITRWWLLFFGVGVVSIPFTWILFKRFIDLGSGFTKTIGFLAITFTAFLVSIFRITPLTSSLYPILFTYVLLNTYLFWKNKQKIASSVKKNLKILISQEILFTTGLIFWATIRGFQPDINGLEKFMDLGFINSILNTQYLPPADMWFSGLPINYYWFGHLFVAVATKLSGITPSITYNLMLATILGLTLTGAFSIVGTLIKKINIKADKRVAYGAGLISAILLVFASNFHAPIYLLKEGPDKYWYPDATRFIGYHPETNDKTIHEFPIYSFVVSDLHAHLINLPFVLLFLALLSNYFLRKKSRPYAYTHIIPLGFILGVMFMTNTWDFGNYLLVSGIAFLLLNVARKGFSLKGIWTTTASLVLILVLALITSLPFILNFTSPAEGIRLTENHTPIWQLGVLWGFPAILTAIFALFLVKFRTKIGRSDLFIISLLIASWVLVLIPEVVFVKDIYIASHQRANTMFKLTYQAYVMFYLSSGYIAIRTLMFVDRLLFRRLLLIFYATAFALILIYPSFAVNSYYGELKEYRGLSGETWLKEKYPQEYRAILWLRENVEGQPVILEAPGDSYTDFNVISSYTGLPTVSGWFVHEWLWRGNSSFPQSRVADINLIYTSSDTRLTKNLLSKYNVEYLIVGTLERQKYPNLNEAKFITLGTPVFSSGKTTIYQLDRN